MTFIQLSKSSKVTAPGTIVALFLPIIACGTSGGSAPQTTSGNSTAGSGSGSATGSTTGAATGSVTATTGDVTGSGSLATTGATIGSGSIASTGEMSGATTGASTGSTTGSTIGSSGASGAVNFDAGLPPGAVNMVPAGYTGTPFKTLTIPGLIYAADYDTGGAGVAFCHVGAANPPTVTSCGAAKLNDWCCGNNKGCDDRSQNQGACPVYRQDADNAGLSHMNLGEPDKYAADGPTWAMGAEGPTLTGPTVTAGTAVPQDAAATTEQDVYISYMYTGQWSNYTVEVLAAGTYAVGGLMGVPPGTTMSLDFGNGVSTGTFTLPVSPCTWTGCPETYHSWANVSNLATVTFTQPGTYVMKFTLVASQFNPLFFTFTKM